MQKNLIVRSGIVGRKKNSVHVGGSLYAKFIQNCRVAVRGDVFVSDRILGSKVYSMGTIRMNEGGKITGGECIVIGGIKVFDIGNREGTGTYIRCGTDFTVQQNLDLANEKIKDLTLRIQKIREEIAEAAKAPLPENDEESGKLDGENTEEQEDPAKIREETRKKKEALIEEYKQKKKF
nr:FapA family protein [Brucepastera parasyntrophica]